MLTNGLRCLLGGIILFCMAVCFVAASKPSCKIQDGPSYEKNTSQ